MNFLDNTLSELLAIAINQLIIEQGIEPLNQRIGYDNQQHLAQNRHQMLIRLRKKNAINRISN